MAARKVRRAAATDQVAAESLTAADAVDEQLARYRSMRDFHVTAEPSGEEIKASRAVKANAGLPFVIQKHAASHLHYDFRLGWNGVLKSWAVAKGPSYFTGDRRLAVEVEDHPMEYGGFEGIIPKGQYGGGTVMVWDQGTWSPQPGHEDVNAGLRDGSLKFDMNGTKMQGKWTLVRMHAREGGGSGRWSKSTKPNWLLIKEHDDFERSKEDPCITEEQPNSAVTGRSLEQIARQEDHVWNSKETARGEAWYRQESAAPTKAAKTEKPKTRQSEKRVAKVSAFQQNELKALPKETQPDFLAPQLALEATGPPAQDGWLHELKLDGYRIQARKNGDAVQLLTRKGLDWTHRMPAIAAEVARLPVDAATLDGEVVVLGEDGTTNFANLQASFQDGAKHELTYFCFDLLHLEGRNVRSLGLKARKEILARILKDRDSSVRLSEHLDTGGEAMFHKACELHAEGIVSKRASASYSAGRSGNWLKSKCLREQEFVIGGFTLSSDGDDRIGSLLLGYYREAKLVYAGRTGTGFTQKTKRSLRVQLGELETTSSPFERLPSEARRGALWVQPQLVAQVRFATWTADDFVRQAAFLGLREDKPAWEVRREEATVAPLPKGTGKAPPPAPEKTSAKPTAKTQVSAVDSPPVRLTHPRKVLDPESGLTKLELAEYYWMIAERMLPHIADRPLSLVRCPEGAGKPCFFQKHVNHMLPHGVGGIDVPNKKTGALEPYITLSTPEALTGLAQMGVLEIHPWGSSNQDLEHPDRLILDLDPDESLAWPTVCEAAAEVRARLKKAGLDGFLKTTGGKGLHIVVPVVPDLDWPQFKEAAHKFVLLMERAYPSLYLTKMSKAARKGKIYLDYLRNERGATAVAPYSPRARAGAHISMPLPWSTLKLAERPVFPVKDFAAWKAQLRNDPWKSIIATQQRLEPKRFQA